MADLSQYDPNDIRNIVNEILSRLRALEQGFIEANTLEEIAGELGDVPISITDDDGNLVFLISQVNLFEEYGVDTYVSFFAADGTPTVRVDPVTGLLTDANGTVVSGDVISDATSSVSGNIVVMSDTDGKHVGDTGFSYEHALQQAGVLFFDDTNDPSISGYKGLRMVYSDAVAGSVVAACVGAMDPNIIEEFITDELAEPIFMGYGYFIADLWVSCSVNQNITFEVEVGVYSGGVETAIGVMLYPFGAFATTGTPAKIKLFSNTIDTGLVDPVEKFLAVDVTDRFYFRVKASLPSDADVTITFDDTHPSFISIPRIPQVAGGGSGTGLTHPQIMSRVSLGF